MERKPSEPNSTGDWADLDLPVPERPLPVFPRVSIATVFALNDELVARTVYDEKYMAESLARKNPERFVL
jgi:hypothetical protein